MKQVIQKIRNLIKRCALSKIDDSQNYQVAQVTYFDKIVDVEVINPYGISSKAPSGSLGLMFNVMGQEENRAAIFNDQPNRFKNLEEGEVAVGNYSTQSKIKFCANGDIEIFSNGDINAQCANLNVTADTTTITAPTNTIDGDLEITGNVTNQGVDIGKTHTHSGVTTGPSNTGGVNP